MVFSGCCKTEVICEWPIRGRDGGDFGTHTRSRGFARNLQCAVSLVIQRLASLLSNGAQKNDQQLLRSNALGVV